MAQLNDLVKGHIASLRKAAESDASEYGARATLAEANHWEQALYGITPDCEHRWSPGDTSSDPYHCELCGAKAF